MNEEFRDYKERSIRWQNTTIQHLGFTNNLIITLSIGLIAVLINKDLLSSISFSSGSHFSLNLTIHIFTLLFLLLSTLSGITNTLSRLYDFRITRNIALTRYRVYKKNRKKLPDFSISKTGFFKILGILITELSSNDLGLITSEDAKGLAKGKPDKLLDKFNELRKNSKALGELTWKSIKFQIVFLFIAIILFSVNLFTN